MSKNTGCRCNATAHVDGAVRRLSARHGELVLDLQTDLLGHFDSRIVVPLLPPEVAPVAHRRLNPTLNVDGVDYVMATQFTIAVQRHALSRPRCNLIKDYDAIRAAINMIFLGF